MKPIKNNILSEILDHIGIILRNLEKEFDRKFDFIITNFDHYQKTLMNVYKRNGIKFDNNWKLNYLQTHINEFYNRDLLWSKIIVMTDSDGKPGVLFKTIVMNQEMLLWYILLNQHQVDVFKNWLTIMIRHEVGHMLSVEDIKMRFNNIDEYNDYDANVISDKIKLRAEYDSIFDESYLNEYYNIHDEKLANSYAEINVNNIIHLTRQIVDSL